MRFHLLPPHGRKLHYLKQAKSHLDDNSAGEKISLIFQLLTIFLSKEIDKIKKENAEESAREERNRSESSMSISTDIRPYSQAFSNTVGAIPKGKSRYKVCKITTSQKSMKQQAIEKRRAAVKSQLKLKHQLKVFVLPAII